MKREDEEHEPGDRNYNVAHTAVTFVLDDGGLVVVEWPFGFATADMTSDLIYLLDKESTSSPDSRSIGRCAPSQS